MMNKEATATIREHYTNVKETEDEENFFAFLDDPSLIPELESDHVVIKFPIDEVLENDDMMDTVDENGFVNLSESPVWQDIEDFTEQVERKADSITSTLGVASQAVSSLGALIGGCGPLCFHGLGSLGQAGSSLSSVGQMSQIGGISNIPGMHIHGDNITFSGSVNELSRRTGFSAADIRAGKFSPGEILAALYSSFGEVMTMVFGGGLFGGIFDLILQTFCGGSQDNSASAMAH